MTQHEATMPRVSPPARPRAFGGFGTIVGAAAAGVLALGVPQLGVPYVTSLAFTFLVFFVLAQSWDWIGGLAGYVNLGHFAYYGIGAYAFSIALVSGVPTPVCFLIAAAAVAMIAALLSFPLFRLTGDYFAFATLAVLPLAELLAFNLVPLTGGADGIVLPPRYVLVPAFYTAVGLAVVTFALSVLLARSRFGYALKSIRNDEQAAEVVGIRIFPAKRAVMVLSGAFAALAGAVHAWQLSYIDPPTVFGLNVALVPVAMALFGGSGLLWGPLVGVVLLFSVQQYLLVNMTMLHATVYGLIILLIGRFMPGGLLRASVARATPLLRGLTREVHHEIAPAPAAAGREKRLPMPVRKPDPDKVLLSLKGITKAFGGNVAVNAVTLDVREGEVIGLVGANGSGKTTLFNCISKVYEPTGTLLFDGTDMKGLRRDQVAGIGVGRTFQNPRPFGDLTVAENIAVAATFRADRPSMTAALQEAQSYAAFVGLEERFTQRADALSLQEKKSLELARALALHPKLLLVDEVASGLTPAEVKRFVAHIREIREVYGVTVIWVEHIFSALAQIVDRLVVLEQGQVIADAPLAEAVRDERVLAAYLGSAATKEGH
ncbi:branched-chain amino acid ABC transporter ATP-binding protein/permease [Xanthobacter sp. KR7-225]|uniref:branched-chain amino acid ABC transporter ATP-binding protein/permease n=1 Tax=Xanthobacter sp. KR7-225 TaxID=3156613 RepID=UPI0032B444B9